MKQEMPGEWKNMNAITNKEITFHPAQAVQINVLLDLAANCSRTLHQVIQRTLDAIPDVSLKSVSANEEPCRAQTRAGLALLADCYARQIYNSSTAARLAESHPDFPWPWWEQLPDASTFRRCRVENRDAIHKCLVAALHFLMEQKITSGALTKIDDPQLAEEASRRIIMAAFADSLELDDGKCANPPPPEISYLFANDRPRGH